MAYSRGVVTLWRVVEVVEMEKRSAKAVLVSYICELGSSTSTVTK